MREKTFLGILLLGSSLVMVVVIFGGVIFAWMTSSLRVGGGVLVGVDDLGDVGVTVVAVNGAAHPVDDFSYFPGDSLDISLSATRDLRGVAVGLSSFRLALEAFEGRFGREDLLFGSYERRRSLDGGDSFVMAGFDLEGRLSEVGLSEGERAAARVAFLKRFAYENVLLSTVTVELTAIRSRYGNIISDFADDPVLFSPPGSLIDGDVNLYSLLWVRGGHPLATGGYVTVGEAEGEGYLVERFNIAENMGFDIRVTYGGTNYQPRISVSGGDELSGYGIEAGEYYAGSYNCFSYQRMKVGFVTV